MIKVFSMILSLCLLSTPLLAANFLVVEGRLTDPSGLSPIEAASVVFDLDVLDDTANDCVLYTEQHTVDMSGSQGYFSLKLGQGSSAVGNFSNALDNSYNHTGLTCGAGSTYNPGTNSHRRLQISFNPNATGIQTLSQLIDIGGSQYANYAYTLEGKSSNDFLQVNTAGAELSQASLQSVFSSTAAVAELNALIAGTSTLYNQSTPAAPVNLNGQPITNVAPPTTGADAVNRDYADQNIGGFNAAGLAPSTGEVLSFNGSSWTTVPAGTGDFMANGSIPMAGPLNMGGNGIMELAPGSSPTNLSLSFAGDNNTGLYRPNGGDEIAFVNNGATTLTLSPNNYVGIGVGAPQESLEVSGAIKISDTGTTCLGGAEGTVRYNTTTNVLEFCNGTNWVNTDSRKECTAGFVSYGNQKHPLCIKLQGTATAATAVNNCRNSSATAKAYICSAAQVAAAVSDGSWSFGPIPTGTIVGDMIWDGGGSIAAYQTIDTNGFVTPNSVPVNDGTARSTVCCY